MKIAIISDIKSNVFALEEVIKDIRSKDIEVVLNLGDMFYGPIAPRATYELIRKNNFINICGDKDREILEASLATLEEDETLNFVYNDLGEDVLYWIQELGFEKLIGETYYMIHGTYFNDKQYLLEDIKDNKLELRDDKKIIELLDDIKAPFIFCGHSHTPRCITLSSNQVVINPGSIGLQALKLEDHIIENNTPDASYVVLNIKENKYSVEHIRVVYDYKIAIETAKNNSKVDITNELKTGKLN